MSTRHRPCTANQRRCASLRRHRKTLLLDLWTDRRCRPVLRAEPLFLSSLGPSRRCWTVKGSHVPLQTRDRRPSSFHRPRAGCLPMRCTNCASGSLLIPRTALPAVSCSRDHRAAASHGPCSILCGSICCRCLSIRSSSGLFSCCRCAFWSCSAL